VTDTTSPEAPVVDRLSTLDRFLPVWIGVAMAAGLLLGRSVPGLNTALGTVQIDGISLPIALGLLIMMYPVLAKVRYDRLDTVTGIANFWSVPWCSTGCSVRHGCSPSPGCSCRTCRSTARV